MPGFSVANTMTKDERAAHRRQQTLRLSVAASELAERLYRTAYAIHMPMAAELPFSDAPAAVRERCHRLAEIAVMALSLPNEQTAQAKARQTVTHLCHEAKRTVLATAEEVLARHVGPIARLLVAKAAKEAADTVALADRLAAHIDDPVKREAFLTAMDQAGASGT